MIDKRMMKKVLFVATALYQPGHPSSTGGTISNYLMLSTFAKHCELTILLLGCNADHLDDLPNARVIRKASKPWGGLELVSKWNPYVRSTTKQVVSEFGPFDGVIASSDTVPCLVPSVIGNASSVVLIRAFENFGRGAPGVTRSTRKSLFKQAIVRRFNDAKIVRNATVVATNSQYMCGAIQDRFGCNEHQCHVIVEQCDLEPQPLYEIPEKIAGFVNRNSDKNLSFVLEMARQTPDLEYLIYGHPPNLESPPGNLNFMGWADDRVKMFLSAKVWLVPSKWPEPFGRVSIEAQAAERAVLVHHTGGLPETVFRKSWSLKSFDTDLWENTMREAMRLSSDALAQNGARIREAFSPDAHDKSVLKLLAKMCSGPSPDYSPGHRVEVGGSSLSR